MSIQSPGGQGNASQHRWLGGVSLLLIAVSAGINLVGYAIAHPAYGHCPLEDMWRGVLLAIASLGTAVPAGACALAGTVARGADRRWSLAGLAATALFAGMFIALWT